ncbi:hypothetical protein OH77DRAFT_1593049 [Trametes cingulata]|nr:hypothetical protein OH77DRAFT_1593049 [Trametes cingulata]
MTALTAKEKCSACEHPYYCHHLVGIVPGHPNTAFQRGGLAESDCGGFHSELDPITWSFQTVCECGRALRSHSFLQGQQFNLAETVFTMQSGQAFVGQHVGPFSLSQPATGPTAASPPVAAAPPMAAYYGVRAAETGRTIDRRNASAERARAASQSRGATPASHLNAPRVRSQTSTPQPGAGPSTATGAIGAAPSSPPTSKDFCVMYIPHVPPSIRWDSYPSATYRWTAADFARLTGVLSQVGLVFDITLPTAGTAWKEFSNQVIAHCRSQAIDIPGIAMASLPTFSGPTHLPFLFLIPTPLRRNVLHRSYHPFDELDVNTFTSSSLLSRPFTTVPRLPLEDKLSDMPLLIIAPRQDNLVLHIARATLVDSQPWSAALDLETRSSSHRCFSSRVMHTVAATINWECEASDCAITYTRAAESEWDSPATPDPTAAPAPSHTAPDAAASAQHAHAGPSSARAPPLNEAPLFLPDEYDSSDVEFPSAQELFQQFQEAMQSRTTSTQGAPAILPSPDAATHERAAEVFNTTPRLMDTERALVGTVRDRSSSLQLSHEEEHRAVRRRGDLDFSLTGSDACAASGAPTTNEGAPSAFLPGPLRELQCSDVGAWAERVRRAVPVDAGALRPHIVAPDGPTAAQALVFLVRWLFKDPSTEVYGNGGTSFSTALAAYVSPRNVTCRLTSLGLLLSCSNNLDIQIGEGIGQATSRTILRLAVKLSLTDSDLWEQRDRYKLLILHPSREMIPSRRARLQACGFLALLHLVTVRTGPDPISPFLLRLALEGHARAMSLDVPFLQRLSPETYTALLPWAERDPTLPLDMSPQSPIGQLLYAANINPRGFSSSPSPDELRGIELALMSEMLLGDKDLSHHPDLIAFKDGMHHVLAPGSTIDATFNGQSRDFLAFVYDRRLHSVDVLLQHLYFHSTAKNHRQDDGIFSLDADGSGAIDVSDWDAINEDLFETRLRTYLQGCGHPNHPHIADLVDTLTCASAGNDPLFRARSFLLMMSGSDLLPLEPDWKLKLYYTHIGNRTAQHEDEPPMPTPLSVHACFYEATVTVDEGLRNLLREEPSSLPDGQALAFDVWVHGALLNPDDYTAV